MPLVCYATANEEQRNLLSFWRRLGVLQHGIGDRWIKLKDEDDIITLCDHDHPKHGWHYLLHENQYAAYQQLETEPCPALAYPPST